MAPNSVAIAIVEGSGIEPPASAACTNPAAEPTFTETSSTFATVGFAAIVLGLLAVVGLAARFGGLTRAAGALGIVMVILFAIQVYRETGTVEMREGAWVAEIQACTAAGSSSRR